MRYKINKKALKRRAKHSNTKGAKKIAAICFLQIAAKHLTQF
jgi:hypothetical protein